MVSRLLVITKTVWLDGSTLLVQGIGRSQSKTNSLLVLERTNPSGRRTHEYRLCVCNAQPYLISRTGRLLTMAGGNLRVNNTTTNSLTTHPSGVLASLLSLSFPVSCCWKWKHSPHVCHARPWYLPQAMLFMLALGCRPISKPLFQFQATP